MMNKLALLLCALASAVNCFAQSSGTLPTIERRAQLKDEFLQYRLENLLPDVMRKEGIDLWLLVAREYNEDAVLETMLPATWLAARRRTMLMIHDPGHGKPLQGYAIARYAVGDWFKKAWDPDSSADQYQVAADLIANLNPRRIGINQSTHYGIADGLSATELELLRAALPDNTEAKLTSAEMLAVGFLERRSELELPHYRQLTQIGHTLIRRAFSREVITPGKTTTDDVKWWLRQKSREMTLSNWFHPSVSIQRPNAGKSDDFSSQSASQVIQPGDLLHVDFGLEYLGLHSDQQQHAYVLREGELRAPEELEAALRSGNRLQDILTSQFVLGRSGNEMLRRALQQASAEGLDGMIYSHPIGLHGHGAGTTIGMWDAQQGVPVQGDYPLHANTAYAIELNVAMQLPSWGSVRIMLEEQALFDGEKTDYLDGRQTKLLLIPSAQ